ncbi:anti-virulence regulator CigR family protein [Bordetella genomosp. 4]|uniref:RcnB family protein n=1 Tax=Bordetella genomosp. 4 TaxID=463044 RepID=A0A261U9M6_9BORD|nr:anti-virulence regulator CigR family protein [Bordetella genomosp. 4]OZI48235.1 hypothetical protein CAL21_10165 [Bordetella genomosp. 4]OZI58301.1 hypothetical protein CAL20_07060 [Bordetella genomosp. 4]
MRTSSLATLIVAAICQVALVSQPLAAPPEGKGKPAQSSQGGGNGNSKNQGNGNGKNKGQSNDSHSNKSSGSKGGNNGKGGHGGGRDSDVNVSLSYAGITVSTARGYAVEYGATRYSALPPGIRKNLARGKPLPPGIAKKMVPGPMLAHLPVHPGYEWQVAGTDLILVAIGTAIIADVLFDVFD